MNKLLVLLLTSSLIAVSSLTMAAGTLEEGMQELAKQIVANSMAKGKKTIGIASFPHSNGDQSELSNYLADELVLKLFNVPESNLEIIERGQLNKIFQEMQFNMTGVVDTKTIQQLGKVHGVDALVLGSVTEMGESIRINARLTDTETGRVFSAAGTTIPKTSTTVELLSRTLTAVGKNNGASSIKNDGKGKSFVSVSGSLSKKTKKKDESPATYNVDLNKYDIGDMPEELGNVTVENGKNIKGKRVIKGFQGGTFKIVLPFTLKNNFEITLVGAGLGYESNTITLISGDKHLKWELSRSATIIQDTKYRHQDTGYGDKIITYHIVSKGRVVKFFLNEQFIGSQLHDPSAEYTSFTITLKKQKCELTDIAFKQK